MHQELRDELAGLVKWAHGKGWAPGTGGNFSRLVSRDPFRLLVTPSGADKGSVAPEDLLIVDREGSVIEGARQPSAETLLHVPIVEEQGAEAVVHTHSVWNTLASLSPGEDFEISGLEMLKGLSGVRSHEHTERVPILDNSQDIGALSKTLRAALRAKPDVHAVLLRGHGVYTWGYDIFQARRHAEIVEFLFEVTLRRRMEM
ncbi:MAG: methylthioribulose 1-phosphate dehydratase [Armatimonadetes bacterium]|nr:methylthioribulose 1-phosphate dehydratase [Armatimonadota bacterium]